jgi:hypothetical protein
VTGESISAAEYRRRMGQPPPGADRSSAEPPFASETAFQIAVVRWWDALEILDGSYLVAIPNGGKRTKVEAAILVGMGVRAGVADLCIMMADGQAAWIELKHDKGTLSPAQREFKARCAKLLHRYFVAWTFADVVSALDQFGVEYVEGMDAFRIRTQRR